MSAYVAPLKDMRFVLNELAGLAEVAKLPGYEEASPDTVDAILEEAGKFAAGVLDPLNATGDREGSTWTDGAVRTPKGFREAYRQFCEGGWNALPFEGEWGGQGLPRLVSTPVQEMWKSANLSFSLCPLLTQGAVEALLLRGSDELKRRYLPKMVEGNWTGTMNLTEPQAGSDLSLVRTRAERQGDHYLISGQKIFITYGQRALAFARERIQGRDLVQGGKSVPIIRHPDVRRMLMLMKSQTEAMRALAYTTAAAMDFARKHPDAEARKRHQAFVDLMIPVVKGWSTETGIEIASLGVQVHGGMGFVEETGAAQYLRDARITTIYEGTTGIQAMDLVGRKIAREAGTTAKAWLGSLKALDAELAKSANADVKALRAQLAQGVQAVSDSVNFIVETKDPRATFAGAVPFLKLMGIVAGGWQMARAALAAQRKFNSGEKDFLHAKIATARFYGDQVLVQAPALRDTVVKGAAGVLALSEEQFLAA